MKSDPNLSSTLFLCFFFSTKLDKLFVRIKRMSTTPPPTLLITPTAHPNNYQGGGSSGGNSSRPLVPHGRGRGQAGYRSGRDDGHHYNYNINNNGGK
jgi:hypothetical protein